MTSWAGHRDPVNELYDHGSELVEAAAALRRAIDDPAVVVATPAAVACIETALRDLAAATAALRRTTAIPARGEDAPADGRREVHRRERMHRGLANLELALRDTADVAAAARALAARGLGEHEP
jgi:hypothetical protein